MSDSVWENRIVAQIEGWIYTRKSRLQPCLVMTSSAIAKRHGQRRKGQRPVPLCWIRGFDIVNRRRRNYEAAATWIVRNVVEARGLSAREGRQARGTIEPSPYKDAPLRTIGEIADKRRERTGTYLLVCADHVGQTPPSVIRDDAAAVAVAAWARAACTQSFETRHVNDSISDATRVRFTAGDIRSISRYDRSRRRGFWPRLRRRARKIRAKLSSPETRKSRSRLTWINMGYFFYTTWVSIIFHVWV